MKAFKHKKTGRYLVGFTLKDKQPITTKVLSDARTWSMETVNNRSSFKRYKRVHKERLIDFDEVVI